MKKHVEKLLKYVIAIGARENEIKYELIN